MGQMTQTIACRGEKKACYDGGATSHKSTEYLTLELQKAAHLVESGVKEPVYCETGFNFGKSAMAASLAGYRVYSFDLQRHAYSDKAAQLVDIIWPGKFTITKGSSFDTVPSFHKNHPDVICDVLTVDGLHTYEGVMKDFKNFAKMGRDGASVFIDDIGPDYIKEVRCTKHGKN
jgi:hypothetical protein